MSKVIEVTQENFREIVVESDKPVIVDFWAEWCGPCKKLGPIIEEVAEELGEQVTVAKVNVDEQRTLGAMFQIMSIPAVLFFKDGEKIDEFVGVRPRSHIMAKLEPLM
ncbi:thioredoxin [Corynebacterium hylobatis]|uniref:Thioredoxin n=1 Tax=Corynebacterium hylobatis TaxID=1859290 RepID=A0A3S0B3J7_9CORY|nr:thioredoxin [Corynebacterium hylobatis]RSZ61941.1 thioredoxin [Corynebacterium hylobatis]